MRNDRRLIAGATKKDIANRPGPYLRCGAHSWSHAARRFRRVLAQRARRRSRQKATRLSSCGWVWEGRGREDRRDRSEPSLWEATWWRWGPRRKGWAKLAPQL